MLCVVQNINFTEIYFLKNTRHREEKLWGKNPPPPIYNDLFDSVNLFELGVGIATHKCPIAHYNNTKRSL